MPLSMADIGEKRLIQRINGKDGVRKFLKGLGFVEGSSVTVVSESAAGLIVSVKDSRVALDRSMANRIIV